MGIVIAVLAIALVAVCFVLNAKHRGELLSAGVILQRQRDFVEYAETFTLAPISNEQFAAAVETANLTAGTASKMQGNSGRIDFQAGGEHFLMVVKNRTVQPVFLFHFLRLFRIDVAERCDPASVRKGQKSLHVCVGNISASYYCCLYHLFLHFEASISSSIFPPSD